MKQIRKKTRGFTIVELLVVIMVIAILAGITVVGYGNWRLNTAKTEVRTDLLSLKSAMKNGRNFSSNGTYPDPSSVFTASKNVTITSVVSGDSYCINAKSKTDTSVAYFITDTTPNPTVGACAASSQSF